MLATLRQEFSALTRSEFFFVLFAMLAGFCISAEYSITRPASHSLFLSSCSTESLPLVWLVTIPLNLALVALYNWMLPKLGPLKIMAILCGLVAGINFLCGLLLPIFPQLIFFQFCWKDLYILFAFQQLWSLIHSTIPATRAKYLYGVIFGCGTIAMVLGSLLPSLFAIQLGSEKFFFVTLPLYAVLYLSYLKAYRFSGATHFKTELRANVRESLSFVFNHRYLLGILSLVFFMQISIALIEYQFSHYLEIEFPNQDVRTAHFSWLLCVVHLSTLVLQLIGTLFLFTSVSLRNNHRLVPLLLLLAAIGQWMNPCFAMASFALILIKSIDWSLFGVMRELLFVPLTIDQKFRAKSVIDIFVYRSSKAAASLFLLGCQLFIGTYIFSLANYFALVIFIAWFILASLLLKKPEPLLQ